MGRSGRKDFFPPLLALCPWDCCRSPQDKHALSLPSRLLRGVGGGRLCHLPSDGLSLPASVRSSHWETGGFRYFSWSQIGCLCPQGPNLPPAQHHTAKFLRETGGTPSSSFSRIWGNRDSLPQDSSPFLLMQLPACTSQGLLCTHVDTPTHTSHLFHILASGDPTLG